MVPIQMEKGDLLPAARDDSILPDEHLFIGSWESPGSTIYKQSFFFLFSRRLKSCLTCMDGFNQKESSPVPKTSTRFHFYEDAFLIGLWRSVL